MGYTSEIRDLLMEMPKLSVCLYAFLRQLAHGDKRTRAQLRTILSWEFGATSPDHQTDMNILIGWCDTYATGANLVMRHSMPKNSLEDEFEITPQGVRVLHLYEKDGFIPMSYMRELFGSRILRGVGSDFSESWSEWAFYDQLEALTDDYMIFHSIKWRSRGGGSEGEIDFLVVHPQKGILILEVKGGVITVRDEGKSQWYSRPRYGKSREIPIDPMGQANRNAREFRMCLKHDPRTHKHNYAVFPVLIFPDSEVVADIRLDIPTDIIVDMRHTNDLKTRFEQIFAYYHQHADRDNQKMDGDDAVTSLRALILPTKTLEPRLSTIFAQERRQIDRFTERQMRVLNFLRFHWQATILGGAGTGKTLIAFEKATQLAQEGHKTLFLGYNKGLIEWANRALTHPNITVDTLHGLVGKGMYWAGYGAEMDAMGRGDFDDNLTQCLIKVTQRLRDNPALLEKHGYDALVVDEGQDFKADQWVHIVKFLRRPVEDVLYVFADDGQRIFGDVRETLIKLGEPFYLDENCRTTQHIHAYAQRYTQNPTKCDDNPVGNPVQIHPAPTPEVAYQTVSDLLHWLIDEQGVPAHEIVVLTPISPKKTTLWGNQTQLGNITVARRITDQHDPKRTVLVSTIHAYKGLECGVAILCELTSAHPDNRNALMYVALTRARHAVYVIGELPAPM